LICPRGIWSCFCCIRQYEHYAISCLHRRFLRTDFLTIFKSECYLMRSLCCLCICESSLSIFATPETIFYETSHVDRGFSTHLNGEI
jgi:hypothetical protein